MAIFWLIFAALAAGTLITACFSPHADRPGAAWIYFFTALLLFGYLHLPFFWVHHPHPIDDENCDIAYVEHDHFLPIWEFLFFRDVHGDYDSYTCKTTDRQTITVNADHGTDAVSEPEEKNLTGFSFLLYDNG